MLSGQKPSSREIKIDLRWKGIKCEKQAGLCLLRPHPSVSGAEQVLLPTSQGSTVLLGVPPLPFPSQEEFSLQRNNLSTRCAAQLSEHTVRVETCPRTPRARQFIYCDGPCVVRRKGTLAGPQGQGQALPTLAAINVRMESTGAKERLTWLLLRGVAAGAERSQGRASTQNLRRESCRDWQERFPSVQQDCEQNRRLFFQACLKQFGSKYSLV